MGVFESDAISKSAVRKTFPDSQQLAQVERELQFYPSTVETPRELSRNQIEKFNQCGYIQGIDVLSDSEVNEHCQLFDGLLRSVVQEGGSSYSIVSAHLKYGRVYDLLTNPRIVACVQDILGEDVIGWGAHYFCKMPGDGKIIAWHQDASYWPLTPSKTLTVWLAIDDADAENACMQVISGTHLRGHLSFRASSEEEQNILTQTVIDAEQYGEVVDVGLKAGQISIHSDLLLHGSGANHSSRRRCGLTLRYCTTDVRGSYGWNDEGVIVSGKDSSGHWANPPRPAND
ncbi:MAG: phytanoyl-CoA dioxygenase family protein [Planctomycetaceae bacterium]|nr:phytanoyl-CoA dioxygenase family protein [Planctomycetaceae bacterium]MBP61028.1 phytanoyl-CoA dioxygenase family protein [Planctomycetaceae bacterium]